MSKYTIGVDFGTESGRAVVVDLANGKEIENAVTEYTHGVIDEKLPDGTTLSDDWALQHPHDYIEVLTTAVPEAIQKANVDPQDVIGISIDFTSCTMLPVDEQNLPLCLLDDLKEEPHSWIKLWKHHAAQPQANELNRILEKKERHVLSRYGGKQSSEWMIAKIMQILEEKPEVYDRTDQFLEATDWVTSEMTGVVRKNSCTAGYKAIWHKREGYIQPDTLRALSPKLVDLYDTKLRGEVYPQGEKAGELQPEMAEKMNLPAGIAVAVGNVDAHVSVPAMRVTREEEMVMVMGTSTCHVLLGKNERAVEGMCGVVEDGVIPGFYGYEAGQPGVGDIFNWFVENYISEEVQVEAREQGKNIHQLMEEKASQLKPGESGLLALDWMNGNRSILVDADLTGLILGLTISTKPEEIYRALIEATAFGTYRIINSFEEGGVPIQRLYACGGLPFKNKMLMQIYSDVTNRPIYVGESEQLPAVGSAMFAAVAAGKEVGGYSDIEEAANHMARLHPEPYLPNQENHAIYQKLYEEYKRLHDYFGRGENDVMKRLKGLKNHRKSKVILKS
ncbi:L-ribulokinase [Geomicrobium halophilum]|uniref:Ribulokinase n=1 Tax=Geomicrobium halophilum TaxID=549000 RepID=A0A841PUW1_9BACL|nr:ribulokinase [Geomicrobium halophilum]MBB6450926.1 L-ribulokinase [Geomicrobium halophilum]